MTRTLSFLFIIMLWRPCELYKISEKESERLRKTCGMLPDVLTNKIFRGSQAKHGEFPFAAALWLAYRNTTENQFYYKNAMTSCTGTLISKRHVITAAHCLEYGKIKCPDSLEESPLYEYHVYFGQLKGRQDASKHLNNDVKPFKVVATHRPEAWLKCQFQEGDIAIFELDRDVEEEFFDEGVTRYICLPTKETMMHKTMTVYGYGLDLENSSATQLGTTSFKIRERLLKGRVTTMDTEDCKNLNADMPKDVFCVHETKAHGVMACKGDSGGGAIQKEAKTRRMTILGTLSFGGSCIKSYREEEDSKGGKYVDVRIYLPWICEITGICYV